MSPATMLVMMGIAVVLPSVCMSMRMCMVVATDIVALVVIAIVTNASITVTMKFVLLPL